MDGALQQDALQTWGGHNRQKGQELLYYRAKCNSFATQGHAEDIMNAAM